MKTVIPNVVVSERERGKGVRFCRIRRITGN